MVHKAGLVNKLSRPLGVEVEFSDCRKMMSKWSRPIGSEWVHDGTLPAEGRELVLPPASGDAFLAAIRKVCVGVDAYAAKVNETCGFHVHVQAADLGMFELRRLVQLWCGIETEVYNNLCDPNRRLNRFCMPMAVNEVEIQDYWQFLPKDRIALYRNRLDTEEKIRIHLIKKLYNINLADLSSKKATPTEKALAKQQYIATLAKFDRVKADKRTHGAGGGAGGCRYASMNVHSYFHRTPGTVEFRLKEGTLIPLELVMWPLFCGWVVESAVRLKDSVVGSISGLEDWCKAVEGLAQPSVITWVQECISRRARAKRKEAI